MKEDALYTGSKRVNPLNVEALEMKSNEIYQILAKGKISFGFWEDISPWSSHDE